jgi:hypothetical protein
MRHVRDRHWASPAGRAPGPIGKPCLKTNLLLIVLIAAAPALAHAAELQARTIQAYDAYLEQARRAFLSRVESGRTDVQQGASGLLSAGPAKEDGIVRLPGGLVHHWVSRAFVRGITLREAVAVSSAFASYRTIYKAIVSSELLAREGDTYRVLTRVKEGEAGISAVLQILSTGQYFYPTTRTAYALSHSHEVREVKNAGARDERLLPTGRDSGYLWRANTFTRFIELEDGVYVETETLGLSRQFPALLGWIIEPIARRVGRRSSETSMREFLAAIQRRTAAEPQDGTIDNSRSVLREGVVRIAIEPTFPRLRRCDYRVTTRPRMLAGMPVR